MPQSLDLIIGRLKEGKLNSSFPSFRLHIETSLAKLRKSKNRQIGSRNELDN